MSPRTLIQSVSRAVDILEAVSASDFGLRLSEIAEETGLKSNTAHNLVQTLVARGYVKKVEGPLYRLGYAAAQLAGCFARGELVVAAENVMQRGHDANPDATWVMSRQMGGQIAVILRMSPEQPGALQRPQGSTFHPYANASGLALMAFLPEDETRVIRKRYPFYEFGAHLWETPRKLADYLRKVRELGHAIPPFPDQAGFRVAVPVRDGQGNVIAAIGASVGDRRATNTDELVRLVVRSGEELSPSLQ